MKIGVELEVNNIHDAVMLDTLIDLWKAKWKAEEKEDDDAEDEQDDCDDESDQKCVYDSEIERKAHKDALDALAKCLRDSGIADISISYSSHDNRGKSRM